MKSFLVSVLVLCSVQSFAASSACVESQASLKNAHLVYTQSVDALEASYQSCPGTPNALACESAYLNSYEQALANLRQAGVVRNVVCAK